MVGKHLSISLTAGDCAPEEIDRETRRLRDQLRELDVESVECARSLEMPDGAKGDAMTIGTLLVTLSAAGGVLTTLINAVQAWASGRAKRSLEIHLGPDKLTIAGGIDRQTQAQLVRAFLERNDPRLHG
jgi:hypothetical protein